MGYFTELIFCSDDYLWDIVHCISRTQLARSQMNLVCSRFNRVISPFLYDYGQYMLNKLFMHQQAFLAVYKDIEAKNAYLDAILIDFPPFYELVDFANISPPKNIIAPHPPVMILLNDKMIGGVKRKNFLSTPPFHCFIGHLLSLSLPNTNMQPAKEDVVESSQLQIEYCIEIFDAIHLIIFENDPANVESFFNRIFQQHKTTLSLRIFACAIEEFPFEASTFRNMLKATKLFLAQFANFSTFNTLQLYLTGAILSREDIEAMKALIHGLINWLTFDPMDIPSTSKALTTTKYERTQRTLSLFFDKNTVTNECLNFMKVDFLETIFQHFITDNHSRTFTVYCSGINFQIERLCENLRTGELLEHRLSDLPTHYPYELRRSSVVSLHINKNNEKLSEFEKANHINRLCFMPYF